jgi:hypothetical protein
MKDEISCLLLLAILFLVAILMADWATRPKDRDHGDGPASD